MLSRGRRLVQYAHSLWGKAWEILGKALAKNRRGYAYHAVIQQQPSPRAERLAISYNKSLTAEKSKSQKTRLSDYLSIFSPPPYTLCAYELHGRFPPIYLCYPSYQNKSGSLVWVYVWMETRMGLPFPFSIFRPYKTALRGYEERRISRKNETEELKCQQRNSQLPRIQESEMGSRHSDLANRPQLSFRIEGGIIRKMKVERSSANHFGRGN